MGQEEAACTRGWRGVITGAKRKSKLETRVSRTDLEGADSIGRITHAWVRARVHVRATGEAFWLQLLEKSKKEKLSAFITRTEYSAPDVSCHGYEGKYIPKHGLQPSCEGAAVRARGQIPFFCLLKARCWRRTEGSSSFCHFY